MHRLRRQRGIERLRSGGVDLLAAPLEKSGYGRHMKRVLAEQRQQPYTSN